MLFLALSGCTQPSGESEKVGSSTQAWTAAELSMLGFEQASQWAAVVGPVTLASSPLHSQGSASLSLSGLEYAQVRNVLPLSKDTSPTPEVVSFDIRVPSVTPNIHWRGAVELYIDAPSVGVWGQYLGYRSLQDVPKDVFTKLEFAVPNAIQTKLQGNYTDLKFTIALNVPAGSQAHLLDRFVIGPDVLPPVCVPVNDNNPCTADDCDTVTNQPIHTPLAPGALCSDGNACNGIETCSASAVCTAGTPPTVDDGNVCTADACSPSGGVTHTPVATGTSCTDGNACNGNETCNAAGACSPGTPPNLDDNNPCTADACSPSGGVTHTPVSAGTSCSDANACNGAETCNAAGACIAGAAPTVDDGNACTADSCDALTGVAHVAVSAGTSCDDGNACNGLSVCNGSASCQPGTPPVVDDGNPCTADSCDAVLGVIHVAVAAGTSCDDGNACNGTSSCNGAGSCQAGTPPVVDDGNPCTADACSPSGGVTHTPVAIGTSCGDGNACNGAETCNATGSCVAGSAPSVDDGNPCTADACSPSGGVTHTPVSAGTSCADSNACNGAEACNGSGTCVAGTPPVVDDGNVCTVDSCDPTNGVTHVAANAGTSCSDANVCNGAETCDGVGACAAGVALEVNDGNPCTVDSCDPAQGATHISASVGTSCADANLCNGTELCDGSGTCEAGSPLVTDDGNACTVDSCAPLTGVVHATAPSGTSCDDGDLCNGADFCAGSSCQHPGAEGLDDGNPCTIDSCDAVTGVVHEQAPEGSACSDGNACNGLELCSATGTCEAGTALLEDDNNPCTVDSCDPEAGVLNEPLAAGASCSLGTCLGTGTCNADVLCERSEAPYAGDTDACTLEFCDEETGALEVVQCSAVNRFGLTTAGESVAFLYEGPNAVQRDVTPGVFDPVRTGVVRGRVLWDDGLGIANARISVLGHPELGWTRTQIQGEFVLAVPGDRELSVRIERAGYPAMTRTARVASRSEMTLEDVVIVQRDHRASRITMNASVGQLATASVMSDDSGARRARVYFPPGTQAVLRLADGTPSEAPELSIRATEYTVGETGSERMPASLPTQIAYTYALELTADEAIAAHAENIEFDRHVFLYTDNFLGFDRGTAMPLGFVDTTTGKWIATDSGVVVEVLSESGGVAVLAGHESLPSSLQPTAEELRLIADTFEPGDTFWRSGLRHFSSWDSNQGTSPPANAGPPPGGDPTARNGGDPKGKPQDRDPECNGSRINPLTRRMAEDVPLVGTSEQLHHHSDRVLGDRVLEVPLVGATLAGPVKRIDVTIEVAGRKFSSTHAPTLNSSMTFIWDGLDAFGRKRLGAQNVEVSVSNVYDAVYGVPSRFGYNGNGLTITTTPTREELSITTKWTAELGGYVPDPADQGGFALTSQHFYDFGSSTLYLGDGSVRGFADGGFVAEPFLGVKGAGVAPTVGLLGSRALVSRSFDGNEYAHTVDVGTDGRVYSTVRVSGPGVQTRLIVQKPEGEIERLVVLPFEGRTPAVSREGRIFLGEDRGGTGNSQLGGVYELLPNDTLVPLLETASVKDIEVSHDGLGLYLVLSVSDSIESPGGLFYFDISGTSCGQLTSDPVERQACWQSRLKPIFGTVSSTITQNDTTTICPSQIETNRHFTILDAEVGPDGELYFTKGLVDWALCRLNVDGSVERLEFIAGGDRRGHGLLAQGGPFTFIGGKRGTATNAAWLNGLFRLDSSWTPTRFGLASTGTDDAATALPRDPFRLTFSGAPMTDLEATTDGGAVFLAHSGLVWRIASTLPRYGGSPTVASADGREFYTFHFDGRHKETRDSRTGALLRSFEYDAQRRFSRAVRHGLGEVIVESIRLQRGVSGAPQALAVDADGAGPAGEKVHALELDASGFLSRIANPASEAFQVSYEASIPGLVTAFTYPSGRTTTYEYDSAGGLLVQRDAPLAGQTSGGEFRYDSLPGTETELPATARTTPSGLVSYFGKGESFGANESRGYSYPDATEHTSQTTEDNVETVTTRDGTRTTTRLDPDPMSNNTERFGANVVTRLPESGLERRATATKSATRNTSGLVTTSTDTQCVTSSVGNLCTTETQTATNRTTASPQGRVTQETLDALQRLVELRLPGAPRLRTQYTGDDVTALIVDPDGVLGNADDRKTQMFYDANGNLARVVDPLTHETLFEDYDASDRPATIVLSDAAEVAMTYDEEGNVATLTPPGKAAHGMTYGPRGRIESYTPPVGNAVSFHYDLDRRMDLIDFGLDTLGQPHQVDFNYNTVSGLLSSIVSPAGNISVGYTAGHMTSLVAPSKNGPITTNIDYDGFLPTSVGWSGAVAGNVSWTYNERFLVQTETVGALPATAVTYNYDRDGLVTQAGALTITRDATSGRVTQKTVGNLRETFQYNAYAELARQTLVRLGAGGVVVETLYDAVYSDGGANGARDALGRIVKKTERIVQSDAPVSGARTLESKTYDYGYNADGRPWLESVAVNGSVVSSYSYDANGNRTSAELDWSSQGYSTDFDASLMESDTEYDSADKLLRYGTKEYAWNEFGQLSSVTDTATGETTAYEYDLYGNLLSVALPDGRTIEYDVDGAGRRVGRHVLDANGNELEFRGWIYRDLLRPSAEVDASGNVVARYVYADGEGAKQNAVSQLATRLGANQDTSLPFDGRNVPEVIELVSGGVVTQRLRLITNQVGTVLAVVDTATGQIVQRREYDEFGRTLFDSNPGLEPFGFAGGLTDEETELVRFGARDYSPSVGRWVARDPVRLLSGMNLYVLTSNDPVNYFDANGCAECSAGPYDWIKSLISWIERIFDGGSTVGRGDCIAAETRLKEKKAACQAAADKCYPTDPPPEYDTVESCLELYEQSGKNPKNPSDDWFNCWKGSSEYADYADACGGEISW